MAELILLKAGFCTHPQCMVMTGGGWKSCRFPAGFALIMTREGPWLWDTGYSAHFFDATRGVYRLYRQFLPVHFDAHESAAQQIRNLGVSPSELRGVIISHCHGDHIGGLRDFPDVPIVMSQEGWTKLAGLRGLRALRQGFLPHLMPEDAAQRLRFIERYHKVALPAQLTPFTEAFRLPESGGEILLTPLPGHAHGHIGAFVHTQAGWTLLAADAAWRQENYSQLRLPMALARQIFSDGDAYLRTLGQLRRLHEGGAAIVLSHED